MPLAPGKRNIGRNIETEQAAGKPHDQAVAIALDVARRKRAEGGSTVKKFHSGPIHSSVAGRTDHLPITVASSSYVLPADCVSHLGENNTLAGFKVLRRMFGGEPYGAGEHAYGQKGGPYGEPLARATGGTVHHTKTASFKGWFGKSKAADKQGNPLTLFKAMYPYDSSKGEATRGFQKRPPNAYNGPEITAINRSSDFPAFNGNEPGLKIAGFFGDKDTANRFGNAMPESAVYPVHLALQNPHVIDAKGRKAADIQFGPTGKPWRDAMRSGKYDGSIIKNTADEGDIYVAMHPHQIKSAIGNSGDFDPTNPDISKARGGSVHRAAGILFVSPDKEVLLLRRQGKDHVGEWALPAGGIEKGETPEQAARRETEEEAGHSHEGGLAPFMHSEREGVVFDTFLAQAKDKFAPTLNEEHDGALWIKPSEAEKLPLHPGVRKALEKLRARKAGGGEASGVPIVAAGGEWVIPPKHVEQIGAGDMDAGHRTLDAFVLKLRKEHIEKLKKMEPPRRD